MDPPLFRRQLAETTKWWSSREQIGVTLKHFRSQELAPTLGPNDEPMALWVTEAMVDEVVARRRNLLSVGVHHGEQVDLQGGRLLLSAPDYTNHNALTMDESDGFFDENDVPPWDLWVGATLGELPSPEEGDVAEAWPATLGSVLDGETAPYLLLVSWIPEAHVDLVTKCISYECIGMLTWLDDLRSMQGSGPRFEKVLPQWLTDAVQQGAAR